MTVTQVLAVLAAIVFLGFFSEIFFKKTKIPDVLILICLGIVIGSLLGWTSKERLGFSSELFSVFSLIFILFQGAINLNIKILIKSFPKTFKLTTLSFVATVVAVTAVSYVSGYSFGIALLMGVILGGTSSAVIIPLVNSIDIKEKYGTILTLESALSDVLAVVGTIAVLDVLRSGKIVASEIFQTLLASFALALIVGLVIGWIWVKLLQSYSEMSKNYLVTIAAAVALYAFVESEFIGASGAIAVLVFGLVLGNSDAIGSLLASSSKSKDESKGTVISSYSKNFYSEVAFFIKTFFFVFLGIAIDFSQPIVFLWGAIITLVIFFIRPFVVHLIFGGEHLENNRIYLEILIAKGLAAAVLSGLVIQANVVQEAAHSFSNLVLSVIFLSILLTSILVFLTEQKKFKGFFSKYIEEHSSAK